VEIIGSRALASLLAGLAVALAGCGTAPAPSAAREARTPFPEQDPEEQPGGVVPSESTIATAPTPTSTPAPVLLMPEPTRKPAPARVETGTLGNWSGSGPADIEVTGTSWQFADFTWSCSEPGTFAIEPFAVSTTSLRGHIGIELTQDRSPPVGAVTVSASPSCDWRLAIWGTP
jgi:hypothetical protein